MEPVNPNEDGRTQMEIIDEIRQRLVFIRLQEAQLIQLLEFYEVSDIPSNV